jgi:hypothetical protein
MPLDLKIPWRAVDSKHVEGLAQELAREIGPHHALFGNRVRALAVRQDCDDVLFAIEGSPLSYALVHLTWTMKTEVDPKYPSTVVYPSIEDWRRLCMLPDAEAWAASA